MKVGHRQAFILNPRPFWGGGFFCFANLSCRVSIAYLLSGEFHHKARAYQKLFTKKSPITRAVRDETVSNWNYATEHSKCWI